MSGIGDIIMNLDEWLQHNNMEVKQFAELIGKGRKTVWRVKNDLPVDRKTAEMVLFVTGGKVNPIVRNQGRPKLSTSPHS
jgi:hypothetical protein